MSALFRLALARVRLGDDLDRATAAMRRLAAALPPQQIAARAYLLYEKFRPAVPSGVRGWGAEGELDLGLIRRMAGRAPGEA